MSVGEALLLLFGKNSLAMEILYIVDISLRKVYVTYTIAGFIIACVTSQNGEFVGGCEDEPLI